MTASEPIYIDTIFKSFELDHDAADLARALEAEREAVDAVEEREHDELALATVVHHLTGPCSTTELSSTR